MKKSLKNKVISIELQGNALSDQAFEIYKECNTSPDHKNLKILEVDINHQYNNETPLPDILQNWNDDFYQDKSEAYLNGLKAWVAQGWNDEKREDVAGRIKWSLTYKEKSIDLSNHNVWL